MYRSILLPCLLCLTCFLGGCFFSTTSSEPEVEDVLPGQHQITSPPEAKASTQQSSIGERDI